MPFWQENRKFLLGVGAALAVTLIGFAIVMGMYRSARVKNQVNSTRVSEIEILSEDLGTDEALEMGREEVLARRWGDVRAQVTQTLRTEFIFEEDDSMKKVRLIEKAQRVGGEWKDRFEKKDLSFDDSVRTLGNVAESQVGDVDDQIARLDLMDRLLSIIDETDLSGVRGIRHDQRQVISIPGSEVAILRLPVRLEVEGAYRDVAALLRGIQEAGKFIQVGKAGLKPGGEAPIRASLELAALRVIERSSIDEDEEGGRGPRRPIRRRRR